MGDGDEGSNVVVSVFGRRDGAQRALIVAPAGDRRSFSIDSGNGPVRVTDWRDLPGEPAMRWAKPVLPDNASDGAVLRRVVVTDESGNDVASAEWSAPAADGSEPFQIVFGSCFAPRKDQSEKDLAELYRAVRDAAGSPAALNVWLGDQVYVDAPWQDGWSAKQPLDVAALKYGATWGVTGDATQGLAACLRQAPNLFVPDDHEFWNGYPKPSLFTLPVQTMARLIQQGFRLLGSNSPHPAAQWKWAKAMGRAYCVFQSDLDAEDFDTSVSPPQLQVQDIGDTRLLLLDQRWHRTIRRAGRGAGFMRDDDLERASNLITAHEGLLVLGLARPIVGFMPPIGALRKAEYGAEDYGSHYRHLWRALRQRAELGRPTVVLAGDVHRFGTQTALDDRLIEMVSSPLSLLPALDKDKFLTRVRRASAEVSRSRRRIAAAYAGEDHPEELPYPEVEADGSWQSRPGRQRSMVIHPKAGVSGLVIDWEDGRPALTLHTATAEAGRDMERRASRFTWKGGRWVEA